MSYLSVLLIQPLEDILGANSPLSACNTGRALWWGHWRLATPLVRAKTFRSWEWLAAMHTVGWGDWCGGPWPGRSSMFDRLEGAWCTWMPVYLGSVSRSLRSAQTQCSVHASSLGPQGSSFLQWAIVVLAFWESVCSVLQMMVVRLPNFWWPVVTAARSFLMQRTTLTGSPVRRSELGRSHLSWRRVLSSLGWQSWRSWFWQVEAPDPSWGGMPWALV